MKRYISLILAATLPLVLFSWFIPTPANQLDFWLLWLLAMVLLALPMVYAEVALAYRSGLAPMEGLQKLTREADASTIWRSFSWLNALIAIVISAMLVAHSVDAVSLTLSGLDIDIPNYALMIGLMVVVAIASVWGMGTTIGGLVLVLTALGLSLVNGFSSFSLHMTPISLAEWGRAMMMALVSVGAGSGIYWFATHNYHVNQSEDSNTLRIERQSATKAVLPIWFVQLFMGLGAMTVAGLQSNITENASISALLFSIGSLCLSAVLLHYAVNLFAHRLGFIKGMLLVLMLSCAMVLVVHSVLMVVMVLLTSITVLLLTVFVGYQMKISHLRKSMNFSSEFTYNLWRVAVRLIVPIAVVAGLIGWIIAWIGQ